MDHFDKYLRRANLAISRCLEVRTDWVCGNDDNEGSGEVFVPPEDHEIALAKSALKWMLGRALGSLADAPQDLVDAVYLTGLSVICPTCNYHVSVDEEGFTHSHMGRWAKTCPQTNWNVNSPMIPEGIR